MIWLLLLKEVDEINYNHHRQFLWLRFDLWFRFNLWLRFDLSVSFTPQVWLNVMTFTKTNFFKAITYFLQKKFEELNVASAIQKATRWLISNHETIECCLHIFLSAMRTLLVCRRKRRKWCYEFIANLLEERLMLKYARNRNTNHHDLTWLNSAWLTYVNCFDFHVFLFFLILIY